MLNNNTLWKAIFKERSNLFLRFEDCIVSAKSDLAKRRLFRAALHIRIISKQVIQ